MGGNLKYYVAGKIAFQLKKLLETWYMYVLGVCDSNGEFFKYLFLKWLPSGHYLITLILPKS